MIGASYSYLVLTKILLLQNFKSITSPDSTLHFGLSLSNLTFQVILVVLRERQLQNCCAEIPKLRKTHADIADITKSLG